MVNQLVHWKWGGGYDQEEGAVPDGATHRQDQQKEIRKPCTFSRQCSVPVDLGS